MPSFLTDENSPIYSQTSGVVHLDSDDRYGLAQGKVNGQIPRKPYSHTSSDSFDESSTHSTHPSEASDARPPLNEDCSSPPSMNYLPNGSPDGRAKGLADGDHAGNGKPITNGVSMTLTDRTVQPSGNGRRTEEDAAVAPNPKDAYPRNSFNSIGSASVQSPVEMYLHQINKSDIRTVENGTPSYPPTPLQVTPAGPGASNLDSDPKSPQSPHRYSSPPLYQPAGSSSASPGLQSPPGHSIKHRHTLEVPKPAPPRGSRDGVDTGFASGRFSPAAGRRPSLSLVRRNTQSLHSNMPRDEIVPDEDALRWAEVYREKRASKKRRKEIEDDDRVLVGTKVDETHANWVTAYNMLTGIRVSVSRTNAKIDRDLTDADFEAKQKSTFDIAGNELVPSAKYDFKFKDYAPWVFRHLRARFGLDPADYLMSLTGKYILSELGSPGKSGSFFYFSRDYKYIIKTIHHGEHKFLRKILKDYYRHVTENPNTLLSQFYGLHRVKMPYGKKIHFVVMNNLFPPHRDIHQTFDLKGSTVGRDYREEDLENNPRATLKDLNWLRRQRHLELGIQKKKLFLDQLQKDVRLLQRLKIMDYSLLVGIHDLQKGNEENLRDKTLRVFNPGGTNEDQNQPSVLMRTPSKLENQRKARELREMIKSERPVPMGETSSRMPDELEEGQNRSGRFNADDGGFQATHENNSPADEIYYLGVIDCLTHYGIIKKLEHFFKGFSSDRTQISALPPQEYGERFIEFISGITMSNEEAHRQAQERDAARIAEAAAAEERQRTGSWGNSIRRRSNSNAAPPIPNYQPPPPPGSLPSGQRAPEVQETMQKAEQEARRTEYQGASEDDVPTRTLRTTITSPSGNSNKQGSSSSSPGADRSREMAGMANSTGVLPVVEEAAEGVSAGERSRSSHISTAGTVESEYRPLTPAKDGDERAAGFGNPLLRGQSSNVRPPPTPPKTGYGLLPSQQQGANLLKPDSADSGYGVSANGNGHGVNGGSGNGLFRSGTGSSQRSVSGSSQPVRNQISRDSLDKALPPLPKPTEAPPPGFL